jgi:hypothetical protein
MPTVLITNRAINQPLWFIRADLHRARPFQNIDQMSSGYIIIGLVNTCCINSTINNSFKGLIYQGRAPALL